MRIEPALHRCLTVFTVLLVAFACTNRADAVVVFADDFNRPDSTTIGSTAEPGSGTWTKFQQSAGTPNGDVVISNNLMLVDHSTVDAIYSVSVPTTGFLAPWNNVLNANPGKVTWTLNMQSSRDDLSGFFEPPATFLDGIGMALITNGTAIGGTQGYGLFWGGSGTVDPLWLIEFDGLTSNAILSASVAPFSDLGTNYLSIRVEYDPTSDTWTLFGRDDGLTEFADPSVDTGYVNLGSVVDSKHTSITMSHVGMFGDYTDDGPNNLFRYDNLAIDVDTGAQPGDYNGDGKVDAADYVRWRDGLSTPFTPLDPQDYQAWKQNFGFSSGAAAATAVPEPAAWFVALTSLFALPIRRVFGS